MLKISNKKLTATFILILMFTQFSFGFYQIQKEAYVDEALWLYSRIPKFWQNIGEMDWNGTRRSDKPGVTVMYTTGLGLLNKNNLINCKKSCADTQKLEKMLLGFRSSMLLLTALFTPLLFILLRKLFDKKTSLFSTSFIALSPILLGMSRIINPDSLLWIFSTGTILSYLVYLKKAVTNNKYLYFAGIFMGLAIATKYVSNILFIFVLILIFLNYIFSRNKWLISSTNNYFKKHLIAYIKFIAISIATFSLIYPAVWVKHSRILKATIFSEAFEGTWPYFLGILLFLLTDTFLLKNYILNISIKWLIKYQLLFKKIISIIFLGFIIILFFNVLTKNPLFNLGNILASPKSSYGYSNHFFFYLTNFYPLLFGISPLAFLIIIWKFLKTLFKKINTNTFSDNIFFYFSFLILLYYLASLFAEVAGTIRYQIILYPLVLIMAGISLAETIIEIKLFRNKIYKYFAYLIFLIFLILPLYQTKPFYLSYASKFLPQKYFLDHKDMGSGSYAVAQYLNSLPNAKNLNVWSDKKGVCTFFVGKCYSRFKVKKFKENKFDYYVISSGRKNLTWKKVDINLRHSYPEMPRIDKLYSRNDYIHIVKLGNRYSSFVKIFTSEKVN